MPGPSARGGKQAVSVNRLTARIRVLHLIGDPGPYGYPFFSLLADHVDRDRFDLRFATIEREGMAPGGGARAGVGDPLARSRRSQGLPRRDRSTRSLPPPRADRCGSYAFRGCIGGRVARSTRRAAAVRRGNRSLPTRDAPLQPKIADCARRGHARAARAHGCCSIGTDEGHLGPLAACARRRSDH